MPKIPQAVKYWLLVLNVSGNGAPRIVHQRTRDIVNLGPLAVDPKYQGKGYGKTLLEKLESLATNQELHCVSCRTDVLAIYKKRGYVIVETTPMAEVIKRNVPDLSELTVTRKDISVHTMMRTK